MYFRNHIFLSICCLSVVRAAHVWNVWSSRIHALATNVCSINIGYKIRNCCCREDLLQSHYNNVKIISVFLSFRKCFRHISHHIFKFEFKNSDRHVKSWTIVRDFNRNNRKPVSHDQLTKPQRKAANHNDGQQIIDET